jgi:hypothetical protein
MPEMRRPDNTIENPQSLKENEQKVSWYSMRSSKRSILAVFNNNSVQEKLGRRSVPCQQDIRRKPIPKDGTLCQLEYLKWLTFSRSGL